MATTTVNVGLSLLLAYGGFLCTGAVPAAAADFAERKQAAEVSAKQGFQRQELRLLKRAPGPGRDQVLRALMSRFEGGTEGIKMEGRFTTDLHKEHLSVIGTEWFLQVYGNGEKVRYRNHGQLDGPNNKPLPIDQRLSEEKLKELGIDFINNEVSGFVKLGSGENLVPYFTEFQIGGGGSTKEGARRDPEYVFASTVVFTRTINGVPIIGPGSKIAVMFANDGTPVGFDYDWPVYEAFGKTQRVLPVSEIRGRAMKTSAFDLESADTVVKRFECGYYDLGSRRHDPGAPVQAGCIVHASQRRIVDKAAYEKDKDSGHILDARVTVIPAGVQVERHDQWPEAAKVLGLPVERRSGYAVPGAGPQQ
jgi:hypothetical protein